MDMQSLKQTVINAIKDRLKLPNLDDRAFTSVDISHPIIQADIAANGKRTVFHRQVNQIIHDLFAMGELVCDDSIPLVRTAITVWPKPGETATAFLYHPDDPMYDPNTYNSRNQELVVQKPGNVLAAQPGGSVGLAQTRNFNMDDDDESKSDQTANVITTTVSGQPVTKQCQIQRRQDTLNIPRILVKAAGWAPGDAVSVTAVGPTIFVRKEIPGHQRVDAEGRIRVHGKNVDAMNKKMGDICLALLVEPTNGSHAPYIQIQ